MFGNRNCEQAEASARCKTDYWKGDVTPMGGKIKAFAITFNES
jgi:hypothetical protein